MTRCIETGCKRGVIADANRCRHHWDQLMDRLIGGTR